jgi:predicted nucleic acid-binding protein
MGAGFRLQDRALARVNLFVDTSVWSLALRRDRPPSVSAVDRLRQALESGEAIFSTGLVLQELLQGFSGPKAKDQIIERFAALPLLVPDREDHIAAADIRNDCRRAGVQVGTIDALLARLCSRHDLVMLTTDRDFHAMLPHVPLNVWPEGSHGTESGHEGKPDLGHT